MEDILAKLKRQGLIVAFAGARVRTVLLWTGTSKGLHSEAFSAYWHRWDTADHPHQLDQGGRRCAQHAGDH